MPQFFKKKGNGPSIESKARLEHKLYLARENPEPVFDLSECELQSVPQGIYSLCKVFRKEVLNLQDNQISSFDGGGTMRDLSLLQVLDLQSNCFSALPDDIRYLKSLKVLNVSNNKLKQLPDAIGCLERLQLLDVSHNQLKVVPSVIGNLHCLQELNLIGNEHLSSLPTTLCQATRLTVLHVDVESFKHPPKEIVFQGVQAIMKFLAAEAGVEYACPVQTSIAIPNLSTSPEDEKLKAKIMQLEKMKATKQKNMLAMTQEMDEHQRKEFLLQDTSKTNKERFLENLMVNESKLEGKILRIRQTNESERLKLIQELVRVENTADEVVSQLLTLRGGTVQHSKDFKHLLEQERQAKEELLNNVYEKRESLRHTEVLKAMEVILEEEFQCEKKLREYEQGRAVITRTLLSQEIDADKQLANLLVNQDDLQTKLIGRLQRDEDLQRAAVSALLERGDARSWGLVQQVSLVESQLAALTAVEMKRKKLKMSEQISDFCEKRVELSHLLIELLAQQADRRKDLLKTMEEMEKCHLAQHKTKHSSDFWLQQYQRLLDSRPGMIADMERTLDPQLAHHLLLGGIIHCLPFLAQALRSPESIAALTDGRLRELGICVDKDRSAILVALRHYLDERLRAETEPSASSVEGTVVSPQTSQPKKENSLISIDRTECVVCMERQCEVVFVPCGHMCSCITCAELLSMCPMCRTDILQKIRAILP